VVTSIASAMSNIPVLYPVTRNVSLARGLVLKTAAIGILGAGRTALLRRVRTRLKIPRLRTAPNQVSFLGTKNEAGFRLKHWSFKRKTRRIGSANLVAQAAKSVVNEARAPLYPSLTGNFTSRSGKSLRTSSDL
jgi:hypothetical protein